MSRKLNKRLRALETRTPVPGPPGTGPGLDDEPVPWLNFVFFSALGLLLVVALALFFGIRAVESTVTARALRALHAAGYVAVDVVARGNDLLLTGTVSSDQDLAEPPAIVAGLAGVDRVEANLFVVELGEADPEAVVGDPIVVSWSGRAVTVVGDVSSDDIESFLAGELEARFSSVDLSEVEVLEGLADETEWIGTVVALVDAAADVLTDGQVFVNPAERIVQLSGEVETRQERRELETTARSLVEAIGFAFTPGVRIPDAPPPKEQVVQLQHDLDELLEGKVVEFETGSAVITAEGRRLLDEIFEALALFPDVPVEIAGHADAQGSAERNLELSERRARAVYDYLVAKGADPDRFVVVGYGDTRPIADNSTAEGRARNRRIEFIALEE
ncbi:MAG TPA: OmpA family protein [Actinobacteria bacterium]|nr:OmpA family protein [Actinomycetota bacterium]